MILSSKNSALNIRCHQIVTVPSQVQHNFNKMSSPKDISLLVGTGGSSGIFASPTVLTVSSFLSALSSHGITQIDTAAVYPGLNPGGSEQILGECHASENFAIDTKILITGLGTENMAKGSLSRENIKKSLKGSLERLRVESVRTLYCHTPDLVTALKETAETMDELWREGKFERVCFSFPTAVLYSSLDVSGLGIWVN